MLNEVAAGSQGNYIDTKSGATKPAYIPPAINPTAERYIRGMKKGTTRWRKLYGNRWKYVMNSTANKMATQEQVKMPPTYKDLFGDLNEKAVSKKQQRFFGMVRAAQKGEMENPSPEVTKAASSMSKSDVKDFAKTKHDKLPERKKVEEGNKSGDSSLRDWFSKSRASDGTPGWVQLGGKYAGKPCAKQPGQTTKPKCGSSKMKRDLNKDEEDAAFRRKNSEDPNPDRKGKAKNVATEETILERGDFWHPDPEKDRKLGGPGANQRAREDRAEKSKPKEDPKKLKKGESYMDYAKRQGKKSAPAPKPKERKRDKIGRAIGRVVDRVGGIKNEEKDHEVSMAQSQLSSVERDVKELKKKLGKKEKNLPAWMQAKITDTEHNMDAAAGYLTKEASGEKDACYKKVKSRYSVWPSAYASGALVKCRKVGAKNWGNKSEGLTFQQFQEKCWQGYKKQGMKKKGDKLVPNCVPEEVTNEGAAWTRKAGQNSEGGLNEKGRKSYEGENPGSDLKAPSKKVGNPRRASFCARMKGMRKRQKPSNNTGDDRLSKSLRAWNC